MSGPEPITEPIEDPEVLLDSVIALLSDPPDQNTAYGLVNSFAKMTMPGLLAPHKKIIFDGGIVATQEQADEFFPNSDGFMYHDITAILTTSPDNFYHGKLQTAMEPFFIRDKDGNTISYDENGVSAVINPTPEAADILFPIIRDRFDEWPRQFVGFYLDQIFDPLPNHVRNTLGAAGYGPEAIQAYELALTKFQFEIASRLKRIAITDGDEVQQAQVIVNSRCPRGFAWADGITIEVKLPTYPQGVPLHIALATFNRQRALCGSGDNNIQWNHPFMSQTGLVRRGIFE